MSGKVIDRAVVFAQNPRWGKISLVLAIISTALGLLFPSKSYSQYAFLLIGVAFLAVYFTVPRYFSGIKITCLQTSPKNSVENQHQNIFKIRRGFGKIDIYVDIPNWASKFEIKMKSDSSIEVTPFENKPGSVRVDGNLLKSDQDIDGFPMTLKLTGDPDDLAEGRYGLKFVDNRAGRQIQRIVLDSSSDPPQDMDEEELNEEEIDAWV
ncbi:hypothetical protein [Haloarchaeobius litoreus]|uniref:Uncharacterized protein n=1 Tax=Haloarchaeobius litoreus TaxID=755306 RepID=A0ABD6DGZ9_9EURY|nr:hypothetical protein [Haloarchaeobius litoreus]